MSVRRGFSLLELVVVVAIIAIIIALLLPAIAAAREAARRTQCGNNMKQVGLALHNYHDSHRLFPPGIVSSTAGTYVAPTLFTESHTSGLTLILPFLEDGGAYRAYNFSVACHAVQNGTATSKPITVFVCPSNVRGQMPIAWAYNVAPPGLKATGAAPTDYVFSAGAVGLLNTENPFALQFGARVWDWPTIHRPAAGMFNVNSSVKIDNIKDGASYSFMMGESSGGGECIVPHQPGKPQPGDTRLGKPNFGFATDQPWSQGHVGRPMNDMCLGGYGSVFAVTAWNAWYDKNRNLAPPDKWFAIRPNEGQGRTYRPTWYAASNPKGKWQADGTPLPGSIGSVQGFRGYHARVVQMLLGDGSVRIVSDTVDATTWAAMSTINGREAIPVD